jgi:nitrate/nitrite transport system substrate-binding protein
VSGSALEQSELVLGFMPLTDAAPLVAAREKGFFARQGLKVDLSREASWASIRDKVALGILDGAQMLAPMPIAASLGLEPMTTPMLAPMTLARNGNGVTLSTALFAAMAAVAPGWGEVLPRAAAPLAQVAARWRRRPVLALVHPFSTHNYLLRCWLAAGGVDPERDVELIVLPPSQMVERLEAGDIDGYCAGEPWNQLAVRQGSGRLVASSLDLWPGATEKVLGVTAAWASSRRATLKALIRALAEAAAWADRTENRIELARLLARERYVGVSLEAIAYPLLGLVQEGSDRAPRQLAETHLFHERATGRPRASHALRYTREMVRWGQLDRPLDRGTARSIFRDDLYRAALGMG